MIIELGKTTTEAEEPIGPSVKKTGIIELGKITAETKEPIGPRIDSLAGFGFL